MARKSKTKPVTVLDALKFMVNKILVPFAESSLCDDYMSDAEDGFTPEEYAEALAVLQALLNGDHETLESIVPALDGAGLVITNNDLIEAELESMGYGWDSPVFKKVEV